MIAIRKTAGRRTLLSGAAVLALVLFLAFSLVSVAWAHQNVTVGDYVVEYGWVNEPAVVGQPNTVVINISPAAAPANAQPQDVDVSSFKVQVVYGPQSKDLELQPLSENSPGQFIAPMTPMRAGKYTVHLGGTIGKTAFNTDVVPEEVQTADVVQFPAAEAAASQGSAPLGLAGWLGIGGLILGAIGTALGVVALARKPRAG